MHQTFSSISSNNPTNIYCSLFLFVSWPHLGAYDPRVSRVPQSSILFGQPHASLWSHIRRWCMVGHLHKNRVRANYRARARTQKPTTPFCHFIHRDMCLDIMYYGRKVYLILRRDSIKEIISRTRITHSVGVGTLVSYGFSQSTCHLLLWKIGMGSKIFF